MLTPHFTGAVRMASTTSVEIFLGLPILNLQLEAEVIAGICIL
jgi:hypothetical protein